MRTSTWNRFVLLLWKDLTIQKRQKIQTIAEILVPVLFSLILVVLRKVKDPIYFPDPTKYNPLDIIGVNLRTFNYNWGLHPECVIDITKITLRLLYFPKNDELEKFFDRVRRKLEIDESIGFDSEAELEDELMKKDYYAGIVCDKSYGNIKVLPKNIKFSIRYPATLRSSGHLYAFEHNWKTNYLFPILQSGPRRKDDPGGGRPPGYYDEGFVNLQANIFEAFAEKQLPSGNIPHLSIQRFPYPPYTLDILLGILDFLLPLTITISFIYSTSNLAKSVAIEKECQLKEAMKIMGLENWLHWMAWFTKAIIFNLITVTLITIVMMVKIDNVAVLAHTDWSVLWFFLLIYSCTMITFAFMVSVFFSNASNAATMAGLLWFIFYVPFCLTERNYVDMSAFAKLTVSLFSNSAMAYGFRLLLRYEVTGVGLQWNNLFTTVTADDNITFGDISLMLIFDAILYLLIALYVEKINPGEYGVPQKWYFPVTCCFSGKRQETKRRITTIVDSNVMEPEPEGKRAGIQIENLRKVFANKKMAVNNLTLNVYEDEITILLGHNGAGKTTTMSMITGLFPPTSGTAYINGKNILYELDAARNSLGFCPQYNVLFNELTVREHIIFYSRLKGLPDDKIRREIRKYVKVLELEPKIDEQSKTLTGGMQRKLSVGVAFCGNSKVVILDEPTSGMDPASRRALWNLLQMEKYGRTILLTTHFMDEADILGDRVAIMSEGVLKAYGTPFFLKKKIGNGYRLICVKNPTANIPNITKLLGKYIPGITVCTNIENELSYELNEDYVSKFEAMLADLEDNAENLGLASYGISPARLEEVFMKVGSDMNKPNILANDNVLSTNEELIEFMEMPLLDGWARIQNQFIAMMEKKYYYSLRNWYIIMIQVITPAALLMMAISISRLFSATRNLPALKLDLTIYKKTVTVLSRSNDLPTNYESIANEYETLIKSNNFKMEVIQNDFLDYLLEKSIKMITTVNSQYMIGASIDKNTITAWFNNAGYHNLPIALGTLHNAILKGMGCKECSISIVNAPLPYSIDAKDQIMRTGQTLGFQFAIFMGLSMSFVAALFVQFYVKERTSRAKLLQMVSGVNIHIYWLTSFLFDFGIYLMISLITVCVFAIFQEPGFATSEELGRVYLIFICFGFGAILLTFLLSLMCSVPSSGYVKIQLLYIITGLGFYIAVYALDALKKYKMSDFQILTFFPHFGLCFSLNNLNIIQTTIQTCLNYATTIEAACKLSEQCCVPSVFSWKQPGILKSLIYMLITGGISYLILIFIEMGLVQNISLKTKAKKAGSLTSLEEDNPDDDVLKEKHLIYTATHEEISKMSLALKDLTKYYKYFLAVHEVTAGIYHSECFGLLGVNGAGKTTIFKMLTGDEMISGGDAWVKGFSVKNEITKVHQHIGYCPQFDALIEDLSGREILRLFCLLRGIPNHKIKRFVETLAIELNFIKHIDKKIKEYSGGNKRKVSTAIALIGNPVAIYLDEPTTGMDPGAKRQFWDMICRIRSSGKTIVLTSHSMEECEALCTRLAIMVNGEFVCIGSSQYLKNKYSQGYLLTIKAQTSKTTKETVSKIEEIKKFVMETFPGAQLTEEYQGLLSYNIPTTKLKWSKMFGLLQDNREKYHIEDYSLSQTSLEQVFLSFTTSQRERQSMAIRRK